MGITFESGRRPKLVTACGRSAHAAGLSAATIATARNTERQRDLEELGSLERLVDVRRRGQGNAAGDENADRNDRDVAAPHQERQDRHAARRPAGPHVRQDREKTEHCPPGRSARRHGRISSCPASSRGLRRPIISTSMAHGTPLTRRSASGCRREIS